LKNSRELSGSSLQKKDSWEYHSRKNPGEAHHPLPPGSPVTQKHRNLRQSQNPCGCSRSSSLRDSLSRNRPFFHFLCSRSTQEDFRHPIACISPDFVSRRRNLNPGPIRAEKSLHCTFFSEFPGFRVHRWWCVFFKSPYNCPFCQKEPCVQSHSPSSPLCP